MWKSHQLPTAEAEDLHGRGLESLGRWAWQGRGRGSFGPAPNCGHLVEERRRGRRRKRQQRLLRCDVLHLRGTVQLQRARLVLEVVRVHELAQELDRRALGLRVIHTKVSQVGSRVAGKAFAGLKPGAAQLTNDVLI